MIGTILYGFNNPFRAIFKSMFRPYFIYQQVCIAYQYAPGMFSYFVFQCYLSF